MRTRIARSAPLSSAGSIPTPRAKAAPSYTAVLRVIAPSSSISRQSVPRSSIRLPVGSMPWKGAPVNVPVGSPLHRRHLVVGGDAQ